MFGFIKGKIHFIYLTDPAVTEHTRPSSSCHDKVFKKIHILVSFSGGDSKRTFSTHTSGRFCWEKHDISLEILIFLSDPN